MVNQKLEVMELQSRVNVFLVTQESSAKLATPVPTNMTTAMESVYHVRTNLIILIMLDLAKTALFVSMSVITYLNPQKPIRIVWILYLYKSKELVDLCPSLVCWVSSC
jgi:hypothetical protein